MDTEDFAYMAAVTLHSLAIQFGPDWVEERIIKKGYTKEEAKVMMDEAYRRRLG